MNETAQPRIPGREFDFSSVSSPDWFHGNSAASHWFDTYTLLVPENEAYYIRNLRHVAKTATPAEKKVLRAFFGQETQHGAAHRQYVARLSEFGLDARGFTSTVGFLFYKLLEPLQTTALKMATVAAIEHVNAFTARIVLSKDLFADCHPEMRDLFYWHFAEEIEHKCVAHDFLVRDYPSYWLRIGGGLIGFVSFFAASWCGMCYLLARRRRLFSRRTLSELKALWIDSGMLKETVGHLAAYFSPRFNPRDTSDYALVDQIRAKLARERFA